MATTEKPQLDTSPVAGDVDGLLHLDVPRVTWYKHRGLRSLYLRMPILMLCATINGYDGSLLNGLQTIEEWRSCTSAAASGELREPD